MPKLHTQPNAPDPAGLRAIFDNAAVGIAIVALDGRFLHFNERLRAITGFDRDELLARTFQDITHPDDLAADLAQVQALIEGRISDYQMEKRYICRDGSIAWAHLSAAAVRDADGRAEYFVSIVEDIGERKRLEQALEANQARMRAAAAVAKLGIFDWSIPHDRAVWTPELEALHGLEPGAYEGTRDAWLRRLHPDDRPRVEARLDESLTTGSFGAEWRVIWPDGTERWLEGRAWIERDARGQPLRMIGANIDITDRKREEALRRRDEIRRLALDSAQMGIWELDLDAGTLTWDERGRALFGLTETEVDTATVFSRIRAEDRPAVEDAIATAGEPGSSGTYDVEFRVSSADGPTRWVRAVGQVLAAARSVGVLMDTTERKRSEAALRASDQHLRLALGGAELGTWIYDIQSDCSSWDAQTREIFGLSADEPIELSEATAIIHPDDRPMALAAVERVLERGGRYLVEKRILRPNAPAHERLRWVRTWGLLTGGEDQPPQLIGIVQDVTAQKRAEEALAEANRRKDDFLAMLSHELRNPLAAIRTAGELMARQRCPDLTRATAVIERQSAHMATLLEGLLDISRITRGKLRVDRRGVELGAILRDVIGDRKAEAEAKGLELHADLEAGAALPLHADPDRLTQIFDNLLGNALKFTPPGGAVTVAAAREADLAVVSVRDTGVGFEPEHGERLFEAFSQGPQDIARSSGGLGLGLALARGLVELHGGTIASRSAGPGRGAEFIVRLPLASPASSELPARAELSPSRAAALRILLIEDNLDSAEMLQQLLEIEGHEVQVALDGSEGVALARRERPDLVLCDIGLPGALSGFDVARILRDSPATRATRLIALTGYGRPEDKARSAAAGFDAHLTKPINLASLTEILAEV